MIFIQQDAASILAESEFPWDRTSPEEKVSPVSVDNTHFAIREDQAAEIEPVPYTSYTNSTTPNPLPVTDNRPSLWPLNDRDESMLVCFYVNDVSPWVREDSHFQVNGS